MKKFVSYLALTAFAVASHMSTVHAWDMFGMAMDGGHEMKAEHSIFCSETPSKSENSDCAKQTVPENVVVVSKSFELPELDAKPLPFALFVQKEEAVARNRLTDPESPPPPRLADNPCEGDGYSARIGSDVKKLD